MTEDKGYLHRRTNNFGKVPYDLMINTTITAGAVRLYAYMHWRYGANCDNHESRDSMATALGVSTRTITNYLKELEAADWIVILFRKGKQGSETNFYHVFELQEDCIKWRVDHRKPKPPRKVGGRASRQGVGGQPTHNSDGKLLNSSSQSNQDGDMLNSSSATPLNSSSDNPDTYDPETRSRATQPASMVSHSHETGDTTALVGSVAGSASAPGGSTSPVVSESQTREALKAEIVEAHTDWAAESKASWARADKTAKYLRGEAIKEAGDTYELPPDLWASPGEYKLFAHDYHAKTRGATLPGKISTHDLHWIPWKKARNAAALKAAKLTAGPTPDEMIMARAIAATKEANGGHKATDSLAA